MDKISIPEKHQEFCRALARLCREHGVLRFSGSYRPGFGDPWGDDINMTWEDGRHGDAADKLHINSTIRVYTNVAPTPQGQTKEGGW